MATFCKAASSLASLAQTASKNSVQFADVLKAKFVWRGIEYTKDRAKDIFIDDVSPNTQSAVRMFRDTGKVPNF